MLRLGLIALASLACTSCSQPSAAPGLPAPGTMRVVSVNPVEGPAQAAGLLRNGRFADWWAGAPAPEGFAAPDPKIATLEKGILPNGAVSVRQTWRGSDLNKGPNQLFSVALEGLDPAKRYELQVQAAVLSGEGVSINLFQAGPDGKPLLIKGPFIKLVPSTGIVKRYLKQLLPPADGKVTIAANAAAAAAAEWYSWELVEATDE